MSAQEKSGSKSGRKPGTFTGADDPRRGRGPKPGHGGRTPDEFKKRMRDLVSRKEVEEYFERCLNGEFGPKFYLAALAHGTDRGYGKAAQPIVGGDGESPARMIVEFVDPPNADSP